VPRVGADSAFDGGAGVRSAERAGVDVRRFGPSEDAGVRAPPGGREFADARFAVAEDGDGSGAACLAVPDGTGGYRGFVSCRPALVADLTVSLERTSEPGPSVDAQTQRT
jgi:hypothetical protein